MKTLFRTLGAAALLVTLAGCTAQTDARRHVSTDPEQCKAIRYACEDGEQAFSDDTGCGCEPAEADASARKYVSNDPNECKTMLFTCVEDRTPFFDDTGCGCQVK